MYRFEKRICLDSEDTLETADTKIGNLVNTLHLTICKINRLQNQSKNGLQDLNAVREDCITEFSQEKAISSTNKQNLDEITASCAEFAEEEVNAGRSALDLIQNIRTLREERRILAKEARSTRRGVLMAQLQAAAKTTPLWIGGPEDSRPPLCGATPPLSTHEVKAGDKVAAKVDENWILAEFISNEAGGTIVVEDIDANDSSKAKITISQKKMMPLPQWRANPRTEPEALHKEGSHVMALYPQTTCFYKGIVAQVPDTPSEDYIVLFEDSTYPSGFSPPMPVAQKYIVEFPVDKSSSSSNAKKREGKGASKLKGKGTTSKRKR